MEARKSKSSKRKEDLEEKAPILIKGQKTGSVGKGLPNALSAGGKKPTMGFPRKAFVCPQKVKDPIKSLSDAELSDSEEDEIVAKRQRQARLE